MISSVTPYVRTLLELAITTDRHLQSPTCTSSWAHKESVHMNFYRLWRSLSKALVKYCITHIYTIQGQKKLQWRHLGFCLHYPPSTPQLKNQCNCTGNYLQRSHKPLKIAALFSLWARKFCESGRFLDTVTSLICEKVISKKRRTQSIKEQFS